MNLRIYCINLKTRPDRWQRFSTQPGLKDLTNRFSFERVEGVNGKELDIANDSRVSIRTRRNILLSKRRDHEDLDSPGGVGCYLSHYTVWNKFAQSTDEACLIFEDDAFIPPDFLPHLEKCWQDLKTLDPQQPDVWVLSNKFSPKLSAILGLESTEQQGVWEYNVHAPNTAYIVFRRGIHKLIQNALPIDGHLDHYMFRLAQLGIIKHVHHTQMNVYQYSLGKGVFRDSDIQEASSCDICDIPERPTQKGFFILNNQNKMSLVIAAAGFTVLYFLSKQGK